jgi:hypothetical protein
MLWIKIIEAVGLELEENPKTGEEQVQTINKQQQSY